MKIPVAPDTLTRSNVHQSGTGTQTIVLLHCLGGNQGMWRPLLPALEKRYRVVLLDLVGCGASDASAYSTERHNTLAGHAADLLDVLRALNLHNVLFMGHSIGAIIGVLAAIEDPTRFASLIMISPSPRFINGHDYQGGYERSDVEALLGAMETDYLGWTQDFAPKVMGGTNRPDLLLAFTNSFARTNPSIARHFARVTFMADVRDDLARLTTPTLILQSARDVMAPLAVGYYLNDNLIDSCIALIDTSGHCPHLTAPAQTMAAIDKFLGYQPSRTYSMPTAMPVTHYLRAAG